MPTLFLIDGSNQAFRAYHAIQSDLRNKDGFPTRALFGFSNILHGLIRRQKPDYMAVVFDVGESFRNELYPEYKGQRPDKPADLELQWPEFCPLCEDFGIKTLSMPGFEADDIIGTLACRFAPQGIDVRIVSSDKDFAQLVNDRIHLFDPRNDETSGPAEVELRWGVPPEKIVDLMSLMGDTSDNVPGIPGVGEKKAAQYIKDYGTWQGVIENAKKIGGKTGEKIAAAADVVALANKLTTIRTDLDIPLTLDDLRLRGSDAVPLKDRLQRYGFFKMIREMGLEDVGKASPIDRSGYRTITTPAQLDDLVAALRAAGRFAYDSETTSLDPLRARIVGMSFCWGDKDAVYVPIGHVTPAPTLLGGAGPTPENCPDALNKLAPLLMDESLKKTGQNLKYDLEVLRANKLDLKGIDGDTMLVDYLLDVDQKHNLDNMALRHLGHAMITYEEVTQGKPFAEVAVPDATRYAAEDAHVAWHIDRLLHESLSSNPAMEKLYRDVELPLVPVLAEMELEGIGVDTAALRGLSTELQARIEEMQRQLYAEAGGEFNLNSTQQLAAILFEKRGHTPTKKTKTGYSTDSATLRQLMDEKDDPLIQMILDYRELAKLKSTYVDTLPDAVGPDQRVHTSYHQAIAATGRLSSFEPNLQNIPVRTEEGKRIRRCFVARPGHRFLSADYSQIELRLLAHYCGGGPLLDAFRNNEDIHSRTASEIFGVHRDLVSSQQRRAAKAINFGIVYGMSSFRLARDLRIPQAEARRYIDDYFARYPQVKVYMESTLELARKQGYVETLYGRRRAIHELDSRIPNIRSAAERVAINTPVQGTAADLIKMAMIRVHARMKKDFPDAKLLLQVHDELILEVPDAQLDAVRAAVVEEMQQTAALKVPLLVETQDGRTWDETH